MNNDTNWPRYYRAKAGLTQAETAARVGIGLRHLQKVESGEVAVDSLTLKNARALAGVLGVTTEELCNGPTP